MSSDVANRTLVLSVVAVDLVGYSRKPVAEQMSLKDNFNQVLVRAIKDISPADRIILDTGDGVAIGFLGDPEDALYVAMFMHDGLVGDGSGNAIRIGINLGPVKLSTGVGGHPNIIGDGINVAERIMGFAEPGQLAVSRPFFEVMSRMSSHYASLFQYAGQRTDKQVRSHDVYLVGKSAGAFHQTGQGVAERAAQRASQAAAISSRVAPISSVPANAAKTTPTRPDHGSVERHAGLIDFLENRQNVATTATSLAVVAVVLGALLGYRKMSTEPPPGNLPVIALPAPATATTENSDANTPRTTAGGAAVKDSAIVAASKTESKTPVPTAPAAKPPPAVTKPTAGPAAPALPIPSATPPKGNERVSPPAATDTSAVGVARDKSKDTKTDKMERGDRADKPGVRDDARKAITPRAPLEREQSAPVTAAPVVPAYQSPVQAPRPESVAPTPSLPPPSAPRVDTNAFIVSRSDPAYPVEGVRQGILRTVIVKARLTIDARGNVSDVLILEGGPIAAFGRETRATLKEWKFNPGTAGRSFDIEITFKP